MFCHLLTLCPSNSSHLECVCVCFSMFLVVSVVIVYWYFPLSTKYIMMWCYQPDSLYIESQIRDIQKLIDLQNIWICSIMYRWDPSVMQKDKEQRERSLVISSLPQLFICWWSQTDDYLDDSMICRKALVYACTMNELWWWLK